MRTHERNTTEHVFPVPDPLLTAKEAAAYRRQGVSTLWRQVKQGLVPKPIYLTARSPRWYLSDLCPIRTQQGSQAQ
jgi:predicted DNA-binding transcriptional regulator AlpA